MTDAETGAYITTPFEEALSLAPSHAEEIDGTWVFRFEDFDIVAESKKELVQRLAEAIQYKRDFESRRPLTEPPPPTQEEVHALAIKFGMQSPEFLEAADALMMASLRAARRKRR